MSLGEETTGPSSRRRSILMVGLPGSGKTTYLAALWHAIRVAPPGSDLHLVRMPDELEYLNRLADDWIACEQAAHSSLGTSRRTTLELQGPGDGHVQLSLPDYSGETIRQAWTSRRWPTSFDRFVGGASGLLLLVHPDDVEPHVTLDAVEGSLDKIASDLNPEQPDPTLRPEPFDPDRAPTQTILVDSLQLIRSRSRRRRIPIAVCVSAWDAVGDGEPGGWLSARLPLLAQFLQSNADVLPASVFGLSAQGTAWPPPEGERVPDSPEDRPWVIAADGTPADGIAAPIRWILRSL